MIIRVVDFETTGMPPDAAVVEAGWYDVGNSSNWLLGATSSLVNPGRPIPPEAMAVHHIEDSDVYGAPAAAAVFDRLNDGADVFAAHHAAFERAFFQGDGHRWICTLKAARRMWPDAPSHSNQTLRYWLKLPLSRSAAEPAHRALPDAYVTAWLLHTLIQAGATIEQMIEWTEQPSLLPRVTFGKHRGLKWSEVNFSYLAWMQKQDFDEDVLFTVQTELERRAREQAA